MLRLQSKLFPAGLKRPDSTKLDVMFAGVGVLFDNRRTGDGLEADNVVLVTEIAAG